MLLMDTFGLFILEKPETSAVDQVAWSMKERTIAVTGIPGKKL